MFIKAFLAAEKWQHQANRRSPVLSLGLKNPASWSNTTAFAVVENITAFFMVSRYHGTAVNFYYSLQVESPTSLIREVGDFEGFDSVSVVFGGIRFHWSRESGKVVITDAVAGQREFDTLTIE